MEKRGSFCELNLVSYITHYRAPNLHPDFTVILETTEKRGLFCELTLYNTL